MAWQYTGENLNIATKNQTSTTDNQTEILGSLWIKKRLKLMATTDKQVDSRYDCNGK